MRSDRLLRSMQKVIRHDLPNQMVALVSLLQLLSAEETTRLSADGREYVRRLQNATVRASEMLRFLKQMEQLNSFVPRLEKISVPPLARELQGERRGLHRAAARAQRGGKGDQQPGTPRPEPVSGRWDGGLPEVCGVGRDELQPARDRTGTTAAGAGDPRRAGDNKFGGLKPPTLERGAKSAGEVSLEPAKNERW